MRIINRAITAAAGFVARRAIATLEKRGTPLQQILTARNVHLHGANGDVPVNEDTALTFSAVFASVRILAETKASLPIKVHEVRPDGTAGPIATQHPVNQLLKYEPTPDHTPLVWKETRQEHVCLWGNTYSELTIDPATGYVNEAYPLDPSKVTPFRNPEDGRIWYRVQSDDRKPERMLDRSQMLHVPGLGDGITGWSVVRMAANTIGIGLKYDGLAGQFAKNGGRDLMVAQHPGKLSDEAYERLKTSIQDKYSMEQANFLLFEGGLNATFARMPLRDAQFLESRKFQTEEIAARWFRLPPHMVGLLDKASYNNIQEQDRYFEKHTMRPWLLRDEQEMERKLLPTSDRGRFVIKHNVDAILRSDIKSRFESHKTAIMTGFQTINEVRQKEDLEPLEGGDRLVLPEAIFGKQLGNQPNENTGEVDARSDERLRALTLQTVEGLLERERVHVTRAAKKPAEFRAKLDDLYEKQSELVCSKLSPVFGETSGPLIAAWVRSRQSELSMLDTNQITDDRLAFDGDAEHLVDQLLGEHHATD